MQSLGRGRFRVAWSEKMGKKFQERLNFGGKMVCKLILNVAIPAELLENRSDFLFELNGPLHIFVIYTKNAPNIEESASTVL